MLAIMGVPMPQDTSTFLKEVCRSIPPGGRRRVTSGRKTVLRGDEVGPLSAPIVHVPQWCVCEEDDPPFSPDDSDALSERTHV